MGPADCSAERPIRVTQIKWEKTLARQGVLIEKLMLRLEAPGTVGIAGSLESGVIRVGIERPGHHDLAVCFFRDDEPVGGFAVFNPIHDPRKPIHDSGTTTAPDAKTAAHQDEPRIHG